MHAETVVTARLVLTPLRVSDADVMVDVLGAEALHEFTGGRPAGLFELRRRYERQTAGPADPDERWLNWIVRAAPATDPDAAAVGTVQATLTRHGDGWTAEVAWVIGVPWQSRGYAGEAAAGLVRWLLDRGVRPVTANIHPLHHASARVAARAGLTVTTDEVDGERIWRTA